MRSIGSVSIGLVVVTALGLFALPVLADWNPGDPAKWVQLPDPQGWDVNATYPKVLADDFLCTQTGPITDVHLWVSTHQYDGPPPIQSIHLSFHSDVQGPPFSHPGALLWSTDIPVPNPLVKIRQYGEGQEGWYDPNTGQWNRPDHNLYYQVNITNIPNPFFQYVNTIYWLDVSFTVPPGLPPVGWKTSYQHNLDDAVWGDFPEPNWQPLHDPITGQSLDMAFVLTPEPASVLLLGLATALIRRR